MKIIGLKANVIAAVQALVMDAGLKAFIVSRLNAMTTNGASVVFNNINPAFTLSVFPVTLA